jgi:hypothetical protein
MRLLQTLPGCREVAGCFCQLCDQVVQSGQFSGLSQNQALNFVGMSEASLVVTGVRFRICRGSATATVLDLDLDLSDGIIVPSSVFVPSRAAALGVTRIDPLAFGGRRIKSMVILRHVQILCPSCFSSCESLSSISFETDSELTRIESDAFSFCPSLKSFTIPHHVQILCSGCFSSCSSLSSISFETDSELTRIESKVFCCCSSLKSITIPRHVQILFRRPALSKIEREPENEANALVEEDVALLDADAAQREREMRINQDLELELERERGDGEQHQEDGSDDDFEPMDGLEDVDFLIDPGF